MSSSHQSSQNQEQEQEQECVFNFHGFSRGLNEFLDACSEFKKEFSDHREMMFIAERIVHTLTTNLHLDMDNAHHPFVKYGFVASTQEMVSLLRTDVAANIQDTTIRSYLPAFFSSGGVNYEWMTDLLDDFLDFVDGSFDDDEMIQAAENVLDAVFDADPNAPIPPMPDFVPQLVHA